MLRFRRQREDPVESGATWGEIERITQRVRIHNPDDEDMWVEVERITKVKFINIITGERLVWRYKPL